MDVWMVERPGAIFSEPLRRVRRPVPEPLLGEVERGPSPITVRREDVELRSFRGRWAG